ncbi:hypothetical protein H5P28_12900 [Ruficoccus amylovorans]|uniref:Uncharacterized protein n=1 Tax=Ruficoccus amylovorans TaxID=1804625 RepID=A0A842HFV7_9BACT|nr:hypothetical protein [Ruficoccus amylovorans]MBC2595159.1 hypothetical protein [Ruficoccus amylovorans]
MDDPKKEILKLLPPKVRFCALALMMSFSLIGAGFWVENEQIIFIASMLLFGSLIAGVLLSRE